LEEGRNGGNANIQVADHFTILWPKEVLDKLDKAITAIARNRLSAGDDASVDES